ncbi:MAG: hypothetical protein KF749_05320 [Bacteroidetes bacterium]|nr:hypothetical protein [Bacteroidota bacterium]MCW5896443.1 hypothetical protein [Bacteroidota bacterium]
MTKRWRVSPVSLLLLAAVFLVATKAESQTHGISAEELAARAHIVAVGSVQSMQSEWSSDRTKIVTNVTIAVDQYLKGSRQDRTLTITVPGGEVDGVGELYSHVARFRQDEEVVVFAERDAGGVLRVAGGEQGKLSLTTERFSGKRVVGEGELLEAFATRVRGAAQNGQ